MYSFVSTNIHRYKKMYAKKQIKTFSSYFLKPICIEKLKLLRLKRFLFGFYINCTLVLSYIKLIHYGYTMLMYKL